MINYTIHWTVGDGSVRYSHIEAPNHEDAILAAKMACLWREKNMGNVGAWLGHSYVRHDDWIYVEI